MDNGNKDNKATEKERRLDFEVACLYALAEIAHTQFFYIVHDLAPVNGLSIAYRFKTAANAVEAGAKDFHTFLSKEKPITQEATGNSADAFRQLVRFCLDRVTDGHELVDIYGIILKSLNTNHGMVRPQDLDVFRHLDEYISNGEPMMGKSMVQSMDIRPEDKRMYFEFYALGVMSLMMDCEIATIKKVAPAAGWRMKPELMRGMEKLSHGCFEFYIEYANLMHKKGRTELMIPGYIWMYQCVLQCFRAMADRTKVGGEVWKVYNLLKASVKSYWNIDLASSEHDAFGEMIGL